MRKNETNRANTWSPEQDRQDELKAKSFGRRHKRCCLCHEPILGWGNNPAPVMPTTEVLERHGDHDVIRENWCCDVCNITRVIPARLRMIL